MSRENKVGAANIRRVAYLNKKFKTQGLSPEEYKEFIRRRNSRISNAKARF